MTMRETTAVFDLFMNNPYWRGVYEDAPSDTLKEYYRRSFEESGSWILGMDIPIYDTKVELTKEDLR